MFFTIFCLHVVWLEYRYLRWKGMVSTSSPSCEPQQAGVISKSLEWCFKVSGYISKQFIAHQPRPLAETNPHYNPSSSVILLFFLLLRVCFLQFSVLPAEQIVLRFFCCGKILKRTLRYITSQDTFLVQMIRKLASIMPYCVPRETLNQNLSTISNNFIWMTTWTQWSHPS